MYHIDDLLTALNVTKITATFDHTNREKDNVSVCIERNDGPAVEGYGVTLYDAVQDAHENIALGMTTLYTSQPGDKIFRAEIYTINGKREHVSEKDFPAKNIATAQKLAERVFGARPDFSRLTDVHHISTVLSVSVV